MTTVNDVIWRAWLLSSPTRVKIWLAIGSLGSTPGELSATFGLAASTIRYHLKVLEDAGLVEVQRRGRYRVYRDVGVQLTVATGAELRAYVQEQSRG